MLDKIIHFSIHNKLIIGILTLALIVLGGISMKNLPIDAVPDITNNQVQVITSSPSLAAQEVERLITYPVEISMTTIPYTTEVRSISRFGLSVVTVVFKDNVDVYWARQQVSERLQAAVDQIPEGTGRPEMAPVTTGLGEIYQYLLHTKKGFEDQYDAMELRSIQDWIVRRQLLGTKGIADVSSFGGYVKQYEIAIDPQKLKSFNIAISEIFTALEENNQNTGGAYIDKKPNAYFIRSEGLIKNLEDIEKIMVKQNQEGVPVLISDLAKVQLGHAIRYGAMTRNDEGEVVGGLVLMLKDANSSEVIKNVKNRIDQIRKTLPEGVIIEPYLDRTKLVNNAIGTVSKNLIEGALIVIFVLVLMLGNLRAGLVVASVIPLSMLFAVCMMRIFGVSGNLMSLGAIDFGLIVDGALIIVEATLHHIVGKNYSHRLSQKEMDTEVYESAKKIRNSAAFGEIIILIVYLPILALVGIEGKMFRPMAQTVSFAILGAFILSLTYVPMVSALFLSKKNNYKPNISDKIIAFFHKMYLPALKKALNHGKALLFIAGALFAISLWVFSRMGGEFIPQLDEGDFAIETRVLTGSSLSQTVDAVQNAAKILKENFPDEVVEVVGKIGAAEIPTDPMPIEAADVMIILSEKSQWTKADNREELAEKMKATLSESIAGVTFGFQQPIQMRFNELMTGVKQDVAIKIFGEDLDVLGVQAQKIGKIVSSVTGAEDLYVETVSGLPQIVVTYDRSRLAQFGVTIGEANRTLTTAFAGSSAGLVYEGEKRYDLVVRFDKVDRRSLEDVQNLFVTSSQGKQVPLMQVAEVEMKTGVNQIQREDAKRRITVAFNVRGRDVESIVNELQLKINEQVELPTGYYLTFGGQFQNLQEANQRLGIAVPAALLLIFVLLYFTFRSLKQSLLILTAIPLSAIGGIIALSLRGMPFSISAGIGFIALFGVAVLNGIVLIGEFNYLRKQGITDLREIIFKGTETRLRPVMMTALVASLGFLPMALSGSAGAEVQRPLATVVIGGLISATLLTLLVLPVLYLFVEQRFNKATVKKTGIIPLLILFALFLPLTSSGQQRAETLIRKISLQEALVEGLAQNLEVKTGLYEIDYRKKLSQFTSIVPKTDFSWMGGQYNSLRFDNSFTIDQKIPNPAVAKRSKDLLTQQVAGYEAKLAITKHELLREIKSIYYKWLQLNRQNQLLTEETKRAEGFVKAANVRYNTGEGILLETTVAQASLSKIQARIIENEANQLIEQHKLRILINSDEMVVPDSITPIKREVNSLSLDRAYISKNPYITFFRQQATISEKQTAVEKTNLLPEFSVGYFNQSLTGSQVGTSMETYGALKRFQGIQLGVALPIFNKTAKAKIEAASIQQKIAENKLRQGIFSLQGEFDQSIQRYKNAKESLDLYESSALELATQLRNNAIKSYSSGEIGYLEYAQSIGEALDIESTYLELIERYNQSVIQIEFLVNDTEVK